MFSFWSQSAGIDLILVIGQNITGVDFDIIDPDTVKVIIIIDYTYLVCPMILTLF